MKKTVISRLFILAIALNLSLYSQEIITPAEPSLEQRREAVKTLIRQVKKDKGIEEILDELAYLSENTPEKLAARQAETIQNQLWKKACDSDCLSYPCNCMSSFIDTPSCKSIEENYIEIKSEARKLREASNNTPEIIAHRTFKRVFNLEKYIPRLMEEKQNIEEKLEEILKEKQEKEEEIQAYRKSQQKYLDSLIN